jgi:hypothetical protein
MTIHLESNFMLLGDSDLPSIDFDRPHLTLAELLEEISGRSSSTLQFLSRHRKALDEGWEIRVNGFPFDYLPHGIETSLRDGDRVAIKLSLLGGG